MTSAEVHYGFKDNGSPNFLINPKM